MSLCQIGKPHRQSSFVRPALMHYSRCRLKEESGRVHDAILRATGNLPVSQSFRLSSPLYTASTTPSNGPMSRRAGARSGKARGRRASTATRSRIHG